MYLAGLNSFSEVIIVIDAGRFKGVKDKKYAGVINRPLNIVFNVINLQGR